MSNGKITGEFGIEQATEEELVRASAIGQSRGPRLAQRSGLALELTSHFMRRCIPPGCVVKAKEYPDIPALSRLACRAPKHLKLRTDFCANPKGGLAEEG